MKNGILILIYNLNNQYKNMKQLLVNLNACNDALLWAGDKSWQEIYATCHRGDWLLWLLFKTMNDKSEEDFTEEDFTVLTHAKGHCANTVRHLMKDQRSLVAIDEAINYCGDRVALKNAADAAYAAANAAKDAANAAYAAAYAAAANAADADAAADAAAYAAAYAAANDAANDAGYDAGYDAASYVAARNRNQLETASIIRRIIPIEKWNIDINL